MQQRICISVYLYSNAEGSHCIFIFQPDAIAASFLHLVMLSLQNGPLTLVWGVPCCILSCVSFSSWWLYPINFIHFYFLLYPNPPDNFFFFLYTGQHRYYGIGYKHSRKKHRKSHILLVEHHDIDGSIFFRFYREAASPSVTY